MMYVALLRAAFDPLTGELPRETLEESFSQSLSRLVDSGEYQLRRIRPSRTPPGASSPT